jgi:hypothetical protein
MFENPYSQKAKAFFNILSNIFFVKEECMSGGLSKCYDLVMCASIKLDWKFLQGSNTLAYRSK